MPPARHGNQYLRAHRLEVTGARVRRRVRRDAHGNVVAWLQADQVTSDIEFRLAAVLERVSDDGPAVLPAAALHSPRLLRADPADRGRRPAAGAGRAGSARESAGATPEETAALVSDAVSQAISYDYGVTTVTTTAAEAAAAGRGVCQDFAHVMLALCHVLELPARYVSGHLLGQGGTHAWVEVIVPRGEQAEAVAVRPVQRPPHRRRLRHRRHRPRLRDVAPVSGSYVGASSGRLTAGRRVGVLAAA